MHSLPKSAALWDRAVAHIPGGVNSPSRHYGAVDLPFPVFMSRGQGAYLWDVDGNRYIDYLAAFGPGILGHAHPRVVKAVADTAAAGTLYGTPTPWEVELAERLTGAIPGLEMVRLVNSGTEAVMSAVRVARAATGRDKVIKFAGCYHGHADFALIKAGSGPATLGQPDSAGIPQSAAADVITVPFNDAGALAAALERWGEQVAAVLVEPIVGNFGIVPPADGFLPRVASLVRQAGALLIADEVITGFRFHFGAAQTLLGVEADLTCLGKALGGGLPIGAYGGRAALMQRVAPLGPAYQAGTMAGNPLAVRAALASLDVLAEPGVYAELDRKGGLLATGLLDAAQAHGVPVQVNRVGSALALYFTAAPVTDYDSAGRSDAGLFARFFQALLQRGILLAPSRFEAWFVQLPLSDQDIADTVDAAGAAFATLKAGPDSVGGGRA